MKNFMILAILAGCISCNSPIKQELAEPKFKENQNTSYSSLVGIQILQDLDVSKQDSLKREGFEKMGQPVKLFDELVWVFDPENFNCGFDERLKRKMKEATTDGQSAVGFLPRDVVNGAYLAENAVLFNFEGSNSLIHSFVVKKSDGSYSEPYFARGAPTSKNYDIGLHIETSPELFNNFAYTCDCSGLLSAGVAASGGFGLFGGTATLKTSAEAAASNQKSLVVIAGIIHSPLFSAFKGIEMFSQKDTASLSMRIKELNALKDAAPQGSNANTIILLHSNYLAVFASHHGEKSFNGKATLEASSGFSFGIGSGSGKVAGSGGISRSSKISQYRTYVVGEDFRASPIEVTLGQVEALISALQAALRPPVATNIRRNQ